MRRKLFSIVLSICMVFTMIPMAGGGDAGICCGV